MSEEKLSVIYVPDDVENRSAYLNQEIKKARGKYICFLHEGDEVEPEFKDCCIKAMEPGDDKKPADLGCVGYDVPTVGEKSPETTVRVLSNEDMLSRIFYMDHDQSMIWNKVFRKDLIQGFHIAFEDGKSDAFDLCFLTEYLLHCDYIRMVPDHVIHHVPSESAMDEVELLEAYDWARMLLCDYEDAQWLCAQNMALTELMIFYALQNLPKEEKKALKKSKLRFFARRANKLHFVPADAEDAALYRAWRWYGFTGKI